MVRQFGLGLGLWLGLGAGSGLAQETVAPSFSAGLAAKDITPKGRLPMWGYGARKSMRSRGVCEPLWAKAVVIEADGVKVALVGMDLGRGPTTAMTAAIRERVKGSGIEHVLIAGSHTHHGPVIELLDEEGMGAETFTDAVTYAQQLPVWLAEVIEAADRNRVPARWGVASRELDLNRNRHSRRDPKPRDPLLLAVRLDDRQGKPIAVLVNWAAHPVMTDSLDARFSPDYPGFLRARVEAELGCGCVFLQGASGDLSPNPRGTFRDPQSYGELLAEQVLELAQGMTTVVPVRPVVQGTVDRWRFRSRVDFSHPAVQTAFSLAFFPQLVRCFAREFEGGVPAELNTVLLNGELAIVGGSGEFFANHANRLRQRADLPNVLFVGYCNGHSMYFPTIEAVAEGGYGADPTMSPVEVGAGERLMDQALIRLYEMLGRVGTLKLPRRSK